MKKDKMPFLQTEKAKVPYKKMDETKFPWAYKFSRCEKYKSMYTIFIICVMLAKVVMADVEIGEQHCGDPNCLGKIFITFIIHIIARYMLTWG